MKEERLPLIPICPICGHDAQEHVASEEGVIHRCFWHGNIEPLWIVDEEKLALESQDGIDEGDGGDSNEPGEFPS